MHIVTLGSGTGQATLLRGLRQYACEVTAVVGVTDNGGHSGQLRRILHLPQMGDTRQCLSALVEPTSIWGQLLSYRFADGDLRGLSVGNVMLAALAQQQDSLCAAVTQMCEAADIRQRVLPVSDGDTQIGAELQDGRQVIGEWEIIQRQPPIPVTRLFLQPPVAAHPHVIEAITQADLLVLCPGSFLTGVLALLLHPGVREAIAASPAPCVYVGNLMTQPGQTDGYTAKQHMTMLHTYLGQQVDAVILNNAALPPELIHLYAQHDAYPVINDLTMADVSLALADIVEHPDAEAIRAYSRPQGDGMQVGLHLIRHDAHKLAAQIMHVASQWMAPERFPR